MGFPWPGIPVYQRMVHGFSRNDCGDLQWLGARSPVDLGDRIPVFQPGQFDLSSSHSMGCDFVSYRSCDMAADHRCQDNAKELLESVQPSAKGVAVRVL